MDIDIELLKLIAKQAGAVIMEIYGEENFAVEMKNDKSPLTAADKASHEVIARGLEKNWPDIPILSEEGASIPYAVRKRWKRFWLVDPLDGTKEFIKRNGEFTVNIALIENQQPVLGVVYAPALERLYWGDSCRDIAWMQVSDGVEEQIEIKNPDMGKGFTVVMSRSHPSPELDTFLKTIKIADAVSVGSSLKLCVVAEGRADLYPRLGPTMEWDTAAGHAIVVAAGGSVTTQTGDPLLYNKQTLLNPYFLVAKNFPVN